MSLPTSHHHHSTSVVAFGAAPAASTTSAAGAAAGSISIVAITVAVAVAIAVAVSLPPRANGDREALEHPAVVMAGRVHAIVDGEVAADHVRAHGGVLLGQLLGFADGVGLVFAVVDAHDAGVAIGTRVGFVERVRPAATAAEAWNLSVSGFVIKLKLT